MAQDGEDWKQYYVNRFVDRDMTMQYYWGLGMGHVYACGKSLAASESSTSICADIMQDTSSSSILQISPEAERPEQAEEDEGTAQDDHLCPHVEDDDSDVELTLQDREGINLSSDNGSVLDCSNEEDTMDKDMLLMMDDMYRSDVDYND
ncbi:hypothetical protein SERLA73DRAFT_69848 [Serpula lacrymans var. lacrymans S7.3]|uniref:Uncharacterized protein n=2 Tax=Serpula lacrymans var. lacrymans TaxID=341189 RepID=F8PIV7_SERL3|nr:hypothetical protein SERLA73DRAFT_69848 [Serpula lacrymans var. lacrymans S7.3]